MGNYDFKLDLESDNTMSIINKWITLESKVLEFGAANGRLTKYLSNEKKCKVTIVEIDEESGSQAAKYADISYLGEEYGNIEKYYWCDISKDYDFIIFADVLEHLSNPQEVLLKCKDFLKASGKILVSIPNIAHNSVIIDLLNDKFYYQKTGLLDRTHIHFFTHKTFHEIVSKCGLHIKQVEPIYGRVGDIEIKNKYDDVPIEVERYLRKRVSGSIYQYVYAIEICKELDEQELEEVECFQLDKNIVLETQLYYRKNQSEYSDTRRFTKKYCDNENSLFQIEIADVQNIDFLRWDPMECSGIVYLEEAFVQSGTDRENLLIRETNSFWNNEKIFVFSDVDPWIEFEKIPKKFENMVVYIRFRVRDIKRDSEYYAQYVEQLKLLSNSEIEILKNEIDNLNEQIKEHVSYIAHLERDIKILKSEVEKKSDLYNHTIESKVKSFLKREKQHD